MLSSDTPTLHCCRATHDGIPTMQKEISQVLLTANKYWNTCNYYHRQWSLCYGLTQWWANYAARATFYSSMHCNQPATTSLILQQMTTNMCSLQIFYLLTILKIFIFHSLWLTLPDFWWVMTWPDTNDGVLSTGLSLNTKQFGHHILKARSRAVCIVIHT